jgi:DNA polymerase elongation subunit (family B)
METNYNKLSNEELKSLRKDCIKNISKYSNNQMARKIQINSLYGAIGTPYFRYYRLENAEAITLSGQVAIRWIECKINKYLNKILKTEGVDYVIASDTDSVYLNMSHLVETIFKNKNVPPQTIVSFLDKVCKEKLEKYIDECYEELAQYVNAYTQKMQMKRENIAERGLWTAKKRYILNVWDSEGVRYEQPKLKIMGIEAIKSSTPSPCRKMLKKSLEILMSGTERDIINYINECKKEFFSLTPEEVSSPKSVSNVNKYSAANNSYQKGTPIQSRASLVYNRYIKEQKLDMKYPLIKDGEKIKVCYLKMPNPINENVIAFIQRFPTDLGLGKFVDYNTQFEKTFISPLKAILDVIDWKTQETSTLDFLFG